MPPKQTSKGPRRPRSRRLCLSSRTWQCKQSSGTVASFWHTVAVVRSAYVALFLTNVALCSVVARGATQSESAAERVSRDAQRSPKQSGPSGDALDISREARLSEQSDQAGSASDASLEAPLSPEPSGETGAASNVSHDASPSPQASAVANVNHNTVPSSGELPDYRPDQTWYGWQIWAADAANIALGLAIMSQAPADPADVSPRLGYVAATWQLGGMLTAPSIHFAHGNVARGFASFGMRAVLPFVALPSLLHCSPDYRDICMQRTAQWVSLGALFAVSAMDGAFFARNDRSTRQETQGDWYGWQGLILDGAGLSIGLSVAIANAHRDSQASGANARASRPASFAENMTIPLWALGVVGGPIIHWSHGRLGIGFASLGMRLLGGVALWVVPLWYTHCATNDSLCKEDFRPIQDWVMFTGQLSASLIDDLVLSWHANPKASSSRGLDWYVTPTPRGIVLGAAF